MRLLPPALVQPQLDLVRRDALVDEGDDAGLVDADEGIVQVLGVGEREGVHQSAVEGSSSLLEGSGSRWGCLLEGEGQHGRTRQGKIGTGTHDGHL